MSPFTLLCMFIGCTPREEARFIKWDAFRDAVKTLITLDLTQRIKEATRRGQNTYEVEEDTFPPDLHFFNLWVSRLQALQRYRKTKRNRQLKIKLNIALAKAKRYTLYLSRSKWR